MMYFSNGGFTHSEIYSMPVYLRTFYYRELIDIKKSEKEEMDKASKKSSKTSNIPQMSRMKR